VTEVRLLTTQQLLLQPLLLLLLLLEQCHQISLMPGLSAASNQLMLLLQLGLCSLADLPGFPAAQRTSCCCCCFKTNHSKLC
jgi:hypothetical protein